MSSSPARSTAWRLLPLDGGWRSHAARWDALNQRLLGGHPLLTSIVVGELLAHYGTGRELLADLPGDDGQSQAMCILVPSSPWRWSSFLPAQTQLALQLMADVEQARGLFRALPWHVLQLDLLCQDPQLMRLTPEPEPLSHIMLHARTVHVDLLAGWDAYWHSRSANLRANMRRYQNRLTGDGKSMHFECHVAADAVAAAVHRYADLETRGWKAQEGTALKSSAAQFDHYLKVMRQSAETGSARVYELYIDGALAASRLTLVSGTTLVILKTTYDENLANYAPGRQHLLQLLQHEFAAGALTRIEFYTNANADTLAWATDSRWIRHVTLERSAPTSLLVSSMRFVRRALKADPATAEGWLLQHAPNVEQLPEPARQLLERVAKSFSALPKGGSVRRYYWLSKGAEVKAVLPVEVDRRWGGEVLRSVTPSLDTALPVLAATDPADPTPIRQLLTQLLGGRSRVACIELSPWNPGHAETLAWSSAASELGLPVLWQAQGPAPAPLSEALVLPQPLIEQVECRGQTAIEGMPTPAPASRRWRLTIHNPSTWLGAAALVRAAFAWRRRNDPTRPVPCNPESSS